MNESDKNFRRKKFTHKNLKKTQISEEQKFLSKANKNFKNKKTQLEEEESWEYWKNQY